jgi:hypothetical protein
MRPLLFGTLGALLAASPAYGTLIWVTPAVHDCASATDDTVRVDVMFNGTDQPIDQAGLNIIYDSSRLTFIRAERGDLVAAWPTFSVIVAAPASIVAIGGTEIPVHISGQFAKLVFVDQCCGLPSPQTISVCPGSLSFDLLGLPTACGDVRCIPAAPGSLTIESVAHTCSAAEADTIEIGVRVENAPQPIDAAGVDIPFNSSLLEYVGYRRGDLTQGWPFFDAANVSSVIRVGGFTSTPIPGGSTGVFVTLRFVLSCCGDVGTNSLLCAQVLVDDFAPLTAGCGQINCVALATRATSWGYIKSLYRQ